MPCRRPPGARRVGLAYPNPNPTTQANIIATSNYNFFNLLTLRRVGWAYPNPNPDPKTQANIIATGNYNFFNLLTLALCVPLLDDGCLPARAAAWLLPAEAPAAAAAPAGAAARAAGGTAGGGGREGEAGAAARLSARRRGARLLGVAAGLAPVAYASARMVRAAGEALVTACCRPLCLPYVEVTVHLIITVYAAPYLCMTIGYSGSLDASLWCKICPHEHV
jgi:hypothetical protein